MTGGGSAMFRWLEGSAWPSRAENDALLWWRVATLLLTRLAGVGRAPRGAHNPGFVGKFDGGRRRQRQTVDSGRRSAAGIGQNGIIPALIPC